MNEIIDAIMNNPFGTIATIFTAVVSFVGTSKLIGILVDWLLRRNKAVLKKVSQLMDELDKLSEKLEDAAKGEIDFRTQFDELKATVTAYTESMIKSPYNEEVRAFYEEKLVELNRAKDMKKPLLALGEEPRTAKDKLIAKVKKAKGMVTNSENITLE